MTPSATCPVCARPVSAEPVGKDHPFCSRRCRQVDFFRWCEGKYAIQEPIDLALLEELAGDPEFNASNPAD